MTRELGLSDTQGILARPGVRPARTSEGLGWESLYLSTQRELPYRDAFDGAPCHLMVLHLDGPVTVRRGRRGLVSTERMPAGGLFLHPAETTLNVELGGPLNTVHAYLTDEALQEAGEEGRQVRLGEAFCGTDPLLEQLLLALDRVVRDRQPGDRTYADQLAVAVAAQLARRHSTRRRESPEPAGPSGLTDRRFAAVRELLDARISEPLPLKDMAEVAGLSVSQFARAFKVRTGQPPHRYLMRLRVEQAVRLLRTSTLPIADISARCGFSHQEHLTRVLRAQLGRTPAALRRSG
ncbi:AraC family transcriptional regulator [Streptosporangium sp. 'caverna']|uniref:AraC family transcriptional regulator n=1 Tax=Streptosporangium sp. 'caverna' TaxID=2202249 RepID=UPI000D7DE052|nr:AraC family transcriptional regulator [Streptosporangium sp. 'caverna']AWS45405.1 AraC family transcriptional regulator [Streptosporangium sp. 'caverna']